MTNGKGIKKVVFGFWDDHPFIGKLIILGALVALFSTVFLFDVVVMIFLALVVIVTMAAALWLLAGMFYDWAWNLLKGSNDNDE